MFKIKPFTIEHLEIKPSFPRLCRGADPPVEGSGLTTISIRLWGLTSGSPDAGWGKTGEFRLRHCQLFSILSFIHYTTVQKTWKNIQIQNYKFIITNYTSVIFGVVLVPHITNSSKNNRFENLFTWFFITIIIITPNPCALPNWTHTDRDPSELEQPSHRDISSGKDVAKGAWISSVLPVPLR